MNIPQDPTPAPPPVVKPGKPPTAAESYEYIMQRIVTRCEWLLKRYSAETLASEGFKHGYHVCESGCPEQVSELAEESPDVTSKDALGEYVIMPSK